MEKILTYEEAFEELTEISQEIENEEVSVDVLAEKVKRASELIKYCQAKLKATDVEVKKIISDLEEGME